MSRNDGLLYSGSTSAAFGSSRTHLVREDKSKTKQESRDKLTPAAEVIAEVIQSERDAVTRELAQMPMNVSITTENVKELLMAYQRHLRFIDSFQTKINNAMRKAGK